MTNSPEDILRRVVEGADNEDFPATLERGRKTKIMQNAETVARQIFISFNGTADQQVPFSLVLKHVSSHLETGGMSPQEQFYFAYLVLTGLEKLMHQKAN